MKTLQEIKDDYAIHHAYLDWNELIYSNDDPDYIDKCNDEIAKLYAKEVAKQALINSSESVFHESDARRIIHESNIPKL